MKGDPVACVIGDMDLVRAVALAGIPVVAAAKTGPETRWSRYTRGAIALPDLWSDPAGTVDALIAFGAAQRVKPVLLYQKDPALLTISRHRAELAPYFDFVLPPADLVESLVDKALFHDLSVELGLPVPRTTIVKGGGWSAELDDVLYPVIVKPAIRDHSDDVWFPLAGRSSKAFRADTPGALGAFLQHRALAGTNLVVQELVDGPEERIWSYHAFVTDDRVTLCEFTGRKIRTLPAQFGQSTAVEIIDRREVTDIGRQVLDAVGFTGVAKVDLKEDREGLLHVLEINPRFSLWHHPGAVAGVNIPAAVYHHLLGRPVEVSTATSGVRWCQVWGDRTAARAAGMSAVQWLRFVARCQSRRAAHLSDPGAMLGALVYGLSGRSSRN